MTASSIAVTATTELSPRRARSTEVMWQRLILFSLVFAAACVMFFADLGKYPLFNPDEALYAEPAREMLETGEYITTLLNYVVRYTKPPLVIWGMAACYQIFGVNEFAARFLGAMCAALMVAATYLFTERYASTRAALIASAALITAPLFIGTAREAITDMPLVLFVATALFAFFHGFTQRIDGWRWLGFALIGLAVMTKGPVGLVLPVAVVGAYHLLRGNFLDAWRYYRPISGLLLVAAIAVPWFAIEIYITKGAYFYEFLVRENFQRFTAVVDHKYPFWYHFAAIAGGFMPWSIFIPAAMIGGLRSLALSKERKFGIYGLFKHLPDERAFVLFSAVTFVTIVTFFSMSVSKLLPYTVPAFPAIAVLIAVYLDKVIADRNGRALSFPLLFLTVALTVGLAVVPVAVTRLRDAPTELISIVYSGLLALIVISAVSCFSAFRKRCAAAVTLFAIAVYGSFLVFGGRAMDLLSNEWEGPIPKFAHYAGMSKWPIFVFHMRKPSVPFYAHRQVQLPHDEAELIRALGESDGAYIIGKAKDLTFLESIPNCRLVAREGRFVLVNQRPRSETYH